MNHYYSDISIFFWFFLTTKSWLFIEYLAILKHTAHVLHALSANSSDRGVTVLQTHTNDELYHANGGSGESNILYRDPQAETVQPIPNPMCQSVKQFNTKRPSFGSRPTKSFSPHLQTFPPYKTLKVHFKRGHQAGMACAPLAQIVKTLELIAAAL